MGGSEKVIEKRIQRFVAFNARMREATLESEKKFLKSAGNISATQLQIILTVGDHPGCTMGAIARILHFSKANITQMVDRLIRDKFLKKSKSKIDQRVCEVVLLAKAKKIVDLNKEHVERVARNWFSKMTDDEQEMMLSILDRYFED